MPNENFGFVRPKCDPLAKICGHFRAALSLNLGLEACRDRIVKYYQHIAIFRAVIRLSSQSLCEIMVVSLAVAIQCHLIYLLLEDRNVFGA